jgi:diaminohydroxyphosphoribosylaminopyrimidine deaminase / 5-amino-6-(5-phosphoribosylamino)uracil reductase
MPDRSNDERFMRRALALAHQGIGLASPNPYVGAVIVDAKGNVAGEGVYTYVGKKHAEVLALERVGERAGGGTLYINLEPHSHQGRTPPCTDALIGAGIKRVVASMPDPNPKVSGRGFEKLRDAGIAVEVGLLEAEAKILNEGFARFIRHGVPLVTLKAAMTLDGKIALADQAPNRVEGVPAGGWITGEGARAHVHQQRHQSDALMVGVGTILADDPLLTDRSGRPRRRPLLRVILDSNLRLPISSRLVQSAAKAGCGVLDVLVFCSSEDDRKRTELEAHGVHVEKVPASAEGRLDISAILRRLGELDTTSLMIEGGASMIGSVLSCGLVDKVFLYYAPILCGDARSVPFARGADLDQPLRVIHSRLHHFDDDFAIEGYLCDPYTD